ncbi:hypothetical protein Tco_0825035 [Tanacetum coccineum]
MNIVNDKVAKLDADLLEMALYLEENFYPHLLTTISGWRWLLTHGVKLDVVKCLNSPEYLTALGSAISRAIEKGMQNGLSADIDHRKSGRSLADIVAYNSVTPPKFRTTQRNGYIGVLLQGTKHKSRKTGWLSVLFPSGDDFVGWARMKVLTMDKVVKLDVDLLEMALHLEEKFYPHLLTTISGRRWLLTRGLKLSVVKCLNSPEYLASLGSAISQLREVDFPLLVELSSHKDASVKDIMNILFLESPLVDASGMSGFCARY